MKISEMKNLGPVAEEKLMAVGINDSQALKKVGTETAFLKVRHLVDEGACLHFLYGLEAAILDIPKKELTHQRKKSLKEFFNELK
ncbi:TfoX/Sxy family DNA transformation protein [Enterococcus sp. AZ103]|uniref:TfoX/Sxy family DNA transformation protein n=1 Tax=Enterococcus sp. AZ103 TaxID=2774628 RepID=UPI003F247692